MADPTVGHAVAAFGPVAAWLGCEPTVVSARAGTTVVVWAGRDLLVEVELVFRERAVFVLVGRTVNGVRPGGYYVCDGLRVRWHLAEILDHVAPVAAAEVRTVTGRRDAGAMLAQVGVLSTVLADHFGEVGGFIRGRVAASG